MLGAKERTSQSCIGTLVVRNNGVTFRMYAWTRRYASLKCIMFLRTSCDLTVMLHNTTFTHSLPSLAAILD